MASDSSSEANISPDMPILDEDSKLVHKHARSEMNRLIVITCLLVLLSYYCGYFNLTFTLPLLICVYIFWIAKEKTSYIHNCFNDEHQRREQQRRALDNAETVEWFNILLNRWWCFSGDTISQLIKRSLDPILELCKPKVIETIELENFTLGTRTPFLRYVKVYEMTEDMRKVMASDVTSRNPPIDITKRQKYQIAVEADMGLDAPESQLIVRIKFHGKLGFTDVVVEQFKIRGHLQIILFYNQNIPFPHLAAFSFSFLNIPKVSFNIRLLKAIQLMEFPMVRAWIEELVNDSLKVSLVDPGHVTIPLCNDPELIGRQVGYAAGVLTITLKGGMHGKAAHDEQWCSVTLNKQKVRTKEISSGVVWQEQVSVLVHSLQYDKLRIKIKGKRMFGPDFTIVEYHLPLFKLNLEQDSEQSMILKDDNIEGSDLQATLNYYSLPVLELSNETEESAFKKNYIEKNAEEVPEEVAGVIFVRVHKGIDLIPMDSSGTSDSYVMIYANKNLVQLGHVVEENLNPTWDTMVEFFTLDYTQTTLSFLLHDRDNSTLPNVLLSDEADDFMGSCNLPLHKEDWCLFKKTLDLRYKICGDIKKGLTEIMKNVGQLIVSVVFRPVSSIKTSVSRTKNSAMPEGEPLYHKNLKIDTFTLEAMLRSERGSLTIAFLRARELMALDINGLSDPFIIVRMGNTKHEKYKSKVISRTLNPVWNEEVTLSMPQRHEKLSIEVWDKDAFTQEKMGFVRFGYDELIHLGEGDLTNKHWFRLQDAKSGEIQIAFKARPASKASSEAKVAFKRRSTELSESFAYGSENEDEYLVLEEESCDSPESDQKNIDKHVKNNSSSLILEENCCDGPHISKTEDEVFCGEKGEIVDFSGEPEKYFGLYGKIIEVTGLHIKDIDEVYVKVRLDKYAKYHNPNRKSILSKTERILCRTSNFQVEPHISINEEFQLKSDFGISPAMYLMLEVKSDKKGKDVIDSSSILLRNFFKGEISVTRLVELDNGGKMKILMGHIPLENDSSHRQGLFSRGGGKRISIYS